MKARILLLLASVTGLALAACQMKTGNDAGVAGNGSAANKAEEGEVSINAPGVQMKIHIPEGLRRDAGISDDSGLVYPASTMSGVHVEGARAGSRSDASGEVELRFASNDAPGIVARWYQDPARASTFTVASATRDVAAFVFTGTRREDHGRFHVRLDPRGSGTDGRVLLSDHD